MKKILFILSFVITCSLFTIIPCFAYTQVYYQYDNSYSVKIFSESPDIVTVNHVSNDKYNYQGYICTTLSSFSTLDDATYEATMWLVENPNPSSYYQNSNFYSNVNNVLIHGPYNSNQEYPDPLGPDIPPDPIPGQDWLSDMWEWFLWQLGINDDYSGDIDTYITGGDRERMEIVTPSPTPSPTPVPSPTPYSLNIIDNNGNPVYTITGIPGSTYNITNTTNNNDGSDFDIFEVDLQIGDGGSTNPRDGLNDVMDTSLTYLSDSENVNMQPVGDSFSIIPNDWFLLLGVIACFPFIAGFISKLLK